MEPADIAALASAQEKLRADPGLLKQPELAFFRELLASWGASAFSVAAAEDVDEAISIGGAGKKATANGVTELESDDEETPAAQREMDLPLGELDDEFESEVVSIIAGERDPELLPKDPGPYPAFPPANAPEPSGARKRVIAKIKRQAADALEEGNLAKAVEKYTEALKNGDVSAMMLVTRAALLLQQKRPCAAIRDCCAAAMLNSNCGKAYLVRGMAQRRLGHYKKAHRDFTAGQKLDTSKDHADMHDFVRMKLGGTKDPQTGQWRGLEEDVKPKVVAKPKVPMRSDLRPGQAVKLDGLLKAPTLNLRRGVILRLDPAGNGRWEVEIRLEKGMVDVKSLQGKNIFVVKANEAGPWRNEEIKHAEERKKREAEAKAWAKEEQDRKKVQEQKKVQRRSQATDIPEMDPEEELEAEMSTLPIDEEVMGLLRRLPTQKALGIVKQAASVSNVPAYIRLKAKQLLGDPDSEEEPVAARTGSYGGAPAQDPETEYDPERLEEEIEPLPPAPCEGAEDEDEELSEAQEGQVARRKEEAAKASEAGDWARAVSAYTEVVLAGAGGVSALLLAKRAEALLHLRRPCAAIQDCGVALRLNPDMGKAFRVRGLAHRRLGHWREAHNDLSQSQKLDYDDGTVALQRLVAQKLRATEEWAARKRRGADTGADAKRARAS